MRSWRLVRFQPPLINQAFDRFLLVKIQFEERVTDLAQLLWVTATVQVAPELFQLEQPPSGERHNEGKGEEDALESESATYALLSFYCVSEMPSVLAIARYHEYDDHDRTIAVAEDVFYDTADDFCRLEDQVEDALLSGIDVSIMSHHDPEEFPELFKYLVDPDSV